MNALFKTGRYKMKCDKELVREYLIWIARGEADGFDKLYEYTGELIYAYILSITGNTHLSEDIKQDTYLKIFNNIEKYDPERNALAWIES
jgi:DNA-directed RNA polymerase specialized sigma24 family protein